MQLNYQQHHQREDRHQSVRMYSNITETISSCLQGRTFTESLVTTLQDRLEAKRLDLPRLQEIHHY